MIVNVHLDLTASILGEGGGKHEEKKDLREV